MRIEANALDEVFQFATSYREALNIVRTTFSKAASFVSKRQVKPIAMIYANCNDLQTDGGA